MQNTTEIITPEHYAVEAVIASLKPMVDCAALERAKTASLLEACRFPEPLTGKKLAETIVNTGEQEITSSLTQYIKSVQISAGLGGLLAGILIGTVIGVAVAMLFAQKPGVPQQRQLIKEHHYMSVQSSGESSE